MEKFTSLAEALQHVASAQKQSTFFDKVVFEGTTAQLFADGWELGTPYPKDNWGRIFYPLTLGDTTVKVRVQNMNAKNVIIKTNGSEKTIKDDKFEAYTKFSVELV